MVTTLINFIWGAIPIWCALGSRFSDEFVESLFLSPSWNTTPSIVRHLRPSIGGCGSSRFGSLYVQFIFELPHPSYILKNKDSNSNNQVTRPKKYIVMFPPGRVGKNTPPVGRISFFFHFLNHYSWWKYNYLVWILSLINRSQAILAKY